MDIIPFPVMTTTGKLSKTLSPTRRLNTVSFSTKTRYLASHLLRRLAIHKAYQPGSSNTQLTKPNLTSACATKKAHIDRVLESLHCALQCISIHFGPASREFVVSWIQPEFFWLTIDILTRKWISPAKLPLDPPVIPMSIRVFWNILAKSDTIFDAIPVSCRKALTWV